MTLLRRASRPFRAEEARPRVVILVKGGVGHNAHVRKSASSLQEAGFEVLVLGARRKSSAAAPAWERDDGFALQVVPAPEAHVRQRRLWAARRAARLESRRDRIALRLRTLREGATSDQRRSLVDRLLRRLLTYRQARVRDSATRARKRAKELESAEKASRELADPHDLARYEAAWWPLVKKLRPDVVHVCDVSGLSTARRAARRGTRWIYDAHEPKRHAGEGNRDEARRRQVTEHASHADAVIATNAPLAEILVKELDLPRMPALVHNAPPLRGGAAPRPGLREAAGVTAQDPLLVYTGVLTTRRHLTVVVEAMATLAEVHLALAVSPEDPLVRELLDRAEELAVSDRVRLVPKVPPESVVPFISEADVGVFPLGRYPGGDLALPNKLFEYLHAGLPMVVSDSPAMADFVRRHGLGEIAPVDDSPAWAQAIGRALQPPHYRDRVSEWEALKEEWCWERQAERLVGLYREVLAAPPRQ